MTQIHKFKINDKYIVLDPGSGSIHSVDPLVYDIIDDVKNLDRPYILAKWSATYPAQDLAQALDELEILEKEGMVFSQEEEVDLGHFNPDLEIKALCLHVAHDCNLRCKYCFASQGDFKGQRLLMDLETGKKAFDFLLENSGSRYHLEVDFFGGEPLMNFGLVKDLVAYGRSKEEEYNKKFRFTLTTNGLLLNDEVIDFVNTHMDNVVLSLDGRQEVNDEMRPTQGGQGSYEAIVKNFSRLVARRGDKDYYIRGTYTNKNLDFSKDVLHYRDLGFKKTSMEPVVTDPAQPYAIRQEHLEAILEEYERLADAYLDIRREDPGFLFFHYMIDLSGGPCAYKKAVGCGAGSDYIAVTPEGDIYPCHQFVGEKDFILGNVFEGIKREDLQRTFQSAHIYNKDDCQACWARYYCSGGCHANAWFNNQDILKPFEIGCEMEKKRLECAIGVYIQEMDEAGTLAQID